MFNNTRFWLITRKASVKHYEGNEEISQSQIMVSYTMNSLNNCYGYWYVVYDRSDEFCFIKSRVINVCIIVSDKRVLFRDWDSLHSKGNFKWTKVTILQSICYTINISKILFVERANKLLRINRING